MARGFSDLFLQVKYFDQTEIIFGMLLKSVGYGNVNVWLKREVFSYGMEGIGCSASTGS